MKQDTVYCILAHTTSIEDYEAHNKYFDFNNVFLRKHIFGRNIYSHTFTSDVCCETFEVTNKTNRKMVIQNHHSSFIHILRCDKVYYNVKSSDKPHYYPNSTFRVIQCNEVIDFNTLDHEPYMKIYDYVFQTLKCDVLFKN